jgi:hypothetical protein
LHLLAVIRLVPIVGSVDDRAIEVEAAIDTLRAAECDQVGGEVGLGAGAHRARGNAHVRPQLERRRQQRVHALVGHHQRDRLGRRNSGLEADTCGGQRIERRAGPLAGLGVPRDQHGAAARTAEDEARLDDFRRDQHALGAAEILLDPGHVGVANEIRERRIGRADQILLLGLRMGKRRDCRRSDRGYYRDEG